MKDNTETGSSINPQQQRRSRLTLLGVLLIFVAPILLAMYLQSDFTEYTPAVTTNSGLAAGSADSGQCLATTRERAGPATVDIAGVLTASMCGCLH